MARSKTKIAACIVGLLRRPQGTVTGEMHTRLKEPDCFDDADRRHRDYAPASVSAQYHLAAFRGGASTVQAGCGCFQHATDYREWIAEYEKRADRSVHS